VEKKPELLGRTFDVEIVEVGKFHMMGRVIDGTLGPEPPRPSTAKPSAASRGRRSTRPGGAPSSNVEGEDRVAALHGTSGGGDASASTSTRDGAASKGAESRTAGTALATDVLSWTRNNAVLAGALALLLFDAIRVLMLHYWNSD
jgi:hypothetical protein